MTTQTLHGPHSSMADMLGVDEIPTALTEEPILTLVWHSYGMLIRKRTPQGIVEHAVDPADVAVALSSAVTFDSGPMPGGPIFSIRQAGTQRVVVGYRRRQKTPLWLEGSEDTLVVPLPALLLIRQTNSQRDPTYRVYALAEPPQNYEVALYHAPLPNLFQHGGVCWGTVPGVAALDNDLSADWDRLLATPFGNHSVNGKCVSHRDDVRKLYLDLDARGARMFPKGELLPARKTLADVLGVSDD